MKQNPGESETDIATLFFTQLKIEDEIHSIWKRIQEIRNDKSIPETIRDLELARLFEVNNRLEIESLRLQEDYMTNFVRSLRFEELDIKPLTEGKLKCHLMQKLNKSKPRPRATSSGFIDSMSDYASNEDYGSLPQANSFRSDILTERRSEIRTELRRLSFKDTLTAEEKQRRQELVRQLKVISDS